MANQPTAGELFKELRDESTLLLRQEIALAKREMGEKFTSSAQNLAYVAAGALIAYSGLMLFLVGISALISEKLATQGLHVGWAYFFGFVIVAVVLALISLGMILKGVQEMKRLSLVPEKTLETVKEGKTWAQSKIH